MLAALTLSAVPAAAQVPAAAPRLSGGLPAYAALNPLAMSRTPLRFVPYGAAQPGWNLSVGLDYGSAIEWNPRDGAEYLLDAELMRIEVGATRELGAGFWAAGVLPIYGAHAGLFDAPIDWYHGLLGVAVDERRFRPTNEYAYHVRLPDARLEPAAPGTFVGDIRLTLARRHGAAQQTALLVALPSSTGGDGFRRGGVGVGITHTVRLPIGARAVYEGSVGLGWAAAAGPLAAYQREGFTALTSGVRVRVGGTHSVYANVLHHAPYYRGTGMPALDRHDLSLDFGWIVAGAAGREVRIGLVEDLDPSGAGIDVVLRVARSFLPGRHP